MFQYVCMAGDRWHTEYLVFMVRGLTEKWNQPICYFLTSSTVTPTLLKYLLFEGIDKLLQCGLNVKLVICDQGSNNRSVLQTQLGVTVDMPYFMYNDKVYL